MRDLVDELNHEYVDWSFSRSVVIGAVIQLQANWMADYRNSDGIELADGLAGPELRIEDSPRVDPWMMRQVDRLACACTERLRAFAVEEGRASLAKSTSALDPLLRRRATNVSSRTPFPSRPSPARHHQEKETTHG